MRTNRTIDEWIKKLQLDMDTLECIGRHYAIAKALYGTKFHCNTRNREVFSASSECKTIDFGLWCANFNRSCVEREIERIKTIHSQRETKRILSALKHGGNIADLPF